MSNWRSSAVLSADSSPRTLSDRAFKVLHGAIVTGTLAPGETLHIGHLAEELEMSTMPIREALRQLDSVGLVENTPHRSARVADLSIADVCEIYAVRLNLEPFAVTHAVQKFTDADADAAQRALAELEAATEDGTRGSIWRAHTEFHFALYRPCGSSWLIRSIIPLWQGSERYRFASAVDDGPTGHTCEHVELLGAFREDEPHRASALLHNHLVQSANRVVAKLGGESETFKTVEVPTS